MSVGKIKRILLEIMNMSRHPVYTRGREKAQYSPRIKNHISWMHVGIPFCTVSSINPDFSH